MNVTVKMSQVGQVFCLLLTLSSVFQVIVQSAESDTQCNDPELSACECLPLKLNCKEAGLDEIPDLSNVNVATKEFVFRSNAIKTVDKDAFKSFRDMKYLDLQNNSINSIAEGAFGGLENLNRLLLRDNNIKSLSMEMFTGLKNLTFLDLTNVSITTLPKGMFSSLSNLETLYLSSNPLSDIDTSAFSDLINLKELHLDHANLKKVDRGIFCSLGGLQILIISNNSFYTTDNFMPAMECLNNLTHLDISSNLLEILPTDGIANMVSLEKLVIRNMSRLHKIDENALNNLPKLRVLYIENNPHLTEFENGAFDGLANQQPFTLEEVYFLYNGLTTVQEKLLPWEKLKVVDLRRNNWSCDCRIAWMANMDYINDDYRDIKCYNPEELRSKEIIGMDMALFECVKEGGTSTFLLVILSLAIIAAVVLCLFFLYRNNVFDKCCKSDKKKTKYVSVIDQERRNREADMLQEMEVM